VVMHFVRMIVAAWLMFPLLMSAQGVAPRMTKVDPPNWWAKMPKPMLPVQGENLHEAQFRLSDTRLRVEKTKVSANGHWAQLWLSVSPARAETVTIMAESSEGKTALPFTFAARRKSDDGFAGFSSKDVMYLITTDRFADGDASNNGASYDRAKPRGWHGGNLRGIAQHLDYLQDLV
jgi:neopullulanase